MRDLAMLAVSAVLLLPAPAVEKPSFHTKGTPTGKPGGPLGVTGRGALGNHLFTLLEGHGRPAQLVAPRGGTRRWLSVVDRADPKRIAARLQPHPEFAGKVHDAIAPGTILIITDQPVVGNNRNAPVFQ